MSYRRTGTSSPAESGGARRIPLIEVLSTGSFKIRIFRCEDMSKPRKHCGMGSTGLERCLALFVPAERAWKQLVQQRQKKPFNASYLPEMQRVKDLYFEALELGFKLCKNESDEEVKKEIKGTILEPMLSRTEELKRQIEKLEDIDTAASSSKDNSIRAGKQDHHNYYEPSKPTSGALGNLFTLPASQRQKPRPVSGTVTAPLANSSSPMGNKATENGGRGNSGSSSSSSSSSGIDNAKGNDQHKLNEFELQLMGDILDGSPGVNWDDIAGLSVAKQTMQETVILPNLRPDIFTGLRSPPKGVLLYGPPGTGKTLLAKAVATESGFTFFNVTSSSVTGKYVGEGEKLMKNLFSMARAKQPTVLFFDEIDALMSARKDSEHEASRRLKTQFMVEVDGAATSSADRILVIGATNIPWELDEAVLRRMSKRIYVPLPDEEARKGLIINLFKKHNASYSSSSIFASMMNYLFSGEGSWALSKEEFDALIKKTEGYSGSDLSAMCKEAAMGPVRELSSEALKTVKAEEMRRINFQDFIMALQNIRPSVSTENLNLFSKWEDDQRVMV